MLRACVYVCVEGQSACSECVLIFEEVRVYRECVFIFMSKKGKCAQSVCLYLCLCFVYVQRAIKQHRANTYVREQFNDKGRGY